MFTFLNFQFDVLTDEKEKSIICDGKEKSAIYTSIKLKYENKVVGELYYYFISNDDSEEIMIEYLKNHDSKRYPKLIMSYFYSLVQKLDPKNEICISLCILFHNKQVNTKLINYYSNYGFTLDSTVQGVTHMSSFGIHCKPFRTLR